MIESYSPENMKLNQDQAKAVIEDYILNNTVHQDYSHCVEYARRMKRWVTGVGLEEDLRRYVPREDEAAFLQRCNLTKSITPALIASAMKPFKKVVKNDRVVKEIKPINPNKAKSKQANNAILKVQDAMDRFYGSDDYDAGLDYWLKTRFFELTQSDPNTFIVIETESDPMNVNQVKPYPFEVNSKMAINFDIDNNNIDWLECKQEISYYETSKKEHLSGVRITCYCDTISVVYHQTAKNRTLADQQLPSDMRRPGVTPEYIKVADKYFWVAVYSNPLNDVSAFRVGYMRDLQTDGRTYVVPYHHAECWIDKSITTVSQFDITNNTQVFPKTFSYVTPCPGESIPDEFKDREGNVRYRGNSNGFNNRGPGIIQDDVGGGSNGDSYDQQLDGGYPNQNFGYDGYGSAAYGLMGAGCTGGYTRSGRVCRLCNGTGVKVHKSGQDIITLPMPDDPTAMFDLSKMMATFSPPIPLLQFQSDMIDNFEPKIHRAVFNTTVMIEKSIVKTATEASDDIDNAYDALSEMASKCKSVWLTVAKFLSFYTNSQDLLLFVYKNPLDWKLRTKLVLYAERKAINDSGSPAFAKVAVDDDIANIVFADDSDALLAYKVKKLFLPFLGKTDAEVEYIMVEDFTPKRKKVLWQNFDDIFLQAQNENEDFYLKPYPEQKAIIDKMVDDLIKELEPVTPLMPPVKIPNPRITSLGTL